MRICSAAPQIAHSGPRHAACLSNLSPMPPPARRLRRGRPARRDRPGAGRGGVARTGAAARGEAAAGAEPPEEEAPEPGRRGLLRRAAAAAGGALWGAAGPARAELGPECEWPLYLALPISGGLATSRRKTIRRELVPGRVWAFDQAIGIFYVSVPIRMTVVAMETGGLFVYAPVAPTEECLGLLRPLIREHGPVRFIVLPSVAVEHKVLAGPFAKRFPSADFYATDRQYAWPLNLPSSFLGLPAWTQPLPASSAQMGGGEPPWAGEFEHAVLRVKPGVGSDYQDAAFLHKPSKTLLVCDALYACTEEPPPILQADADQVRGLLFHARDAADEEVVDTPANRRKGWRRIILYANFFIPGAADADLGPGPIADALRHADYPAGWGGWLPFRWRATERRDFEQFAAGGKPNILPIIQIILARGPEALDAWVATIKGWDFEQVVPAHLDAPLKIGPAEFAATVSLSRRTQGEQGGLTDEPLH